MRRTARSRGETRVAPGCSVAGAQRAAAPDHIRRGERFLQQELREPVIAALSKAVEIDPESAHASFRLGLAMRAAVQRVLDNPVRSFAEAVGAAVTDSAWEESSGDIR